MLSRFGVYYLGVNSGLPPINSLLVRTLNLSHTWQRIVVLIYVATDRVAARNLHDLSFGPWHFSPVPFCCCLVPNLRRIKPECAASGDYVLIC
jgi:hypothetical protein